MSLASYATLVQRWWPGSMLVNIERLQGGVSADVSQLNLKQASGSHLSVVLRAHGENHSGHPAQTEFDLLQALFVKGLPVAQPLAVDETKSLLPNDYLVLTFIGGSSLIESPDHAAYVERAAEMLARIHQTPWRVCQSCLRVVSHCLKYLITGHKALSGRSSKPISSTHRSHLFLVRPCFVMVTSGQRISYGKKGVSQVSSIGRTLRWAILCPILHVVGWNFATASGLRHAALYRGVRGEATIRG